MPANRLLNSLHVLFFWAIPLQLVSMFVLSLLVWLSFNLLLIPLTVIWLVVFLGPLLPLSWLYHRAAFLRIPVAATGIPWALLAGVYRALMPSMGDSGSRVVKLRPCYTLPFTWQYWLYQQRPLPSESLDTVLHILGRIKVCFKGDPCLSISARDRNVLPSSSEASEQGVWSEPRDS